MSRPRLTEIEYLQLIERLSHDVVSTVADEPWFGFADEGQQAPAPWQRAINELATHLRFVHTHDDGCLDHD